MRRKIALGGIAAAIVLAAVPALSATRPGSITLTSLVANQPAAGVVSLEWTWRSGTEVNSLDLVNAYVTQNGFTWKKIADRVSIRQGAVDWDTSDTAVFPDGAYAVRLKVYREPVQSIVSPVFIDNTAPVVDIVSPATNQLIVDGESPPYAVVAGIATLQAAADDALTGIESITWFVDATEIGTGASYTYNFGANPGLHTVRVVAKDFAHNVSEDTVEVLALPGPSALGGEVPDPTTLLPADPTTLIPSDPGTLPADPTTLIPSDPTTLVPTVPSDPTTLVPSDPTTLLPVGIPTP